MRPIHLASGILALALTTSAANAACNVRPPSQGAQVDSCVGFQEVLLAGVPYTSGFNATIEVVGDGVSTQGEIEFHLAPFNTTYFPQCLYGPATGTTNWPYSTSPTQVVSNQWVDAGAILNNAGQQDAIMTWLGTPGHALNKGQTAYIIVKCS